MTDTKVRTAFAEWRQLCDLSIEEAAQALGMTRQMAKYLDDGVTSDGRRVVPQLHTRMLMMAAYKGLDLKPWQVEGALK